MKNLKRLLQIILISSLALSLSACGETNPKKHKTPVITQKISLGQFTDTNIFTGTLEANKESIISAETSGVILNMPIEVGSQINPDTILANISTDNTNTQINGLVQQISALNYQAQTIQDLYGQQIQNTQQNLNNTIQISQQSLSSIQTQLQDTQNITLPDTRAIGDSSFNILKTQLEQTQSNLDNDSENTTEQSEIQNKIAQLDSQLTQARTKGYSSEDSTIVQIHNLENQLNQARLESKSKIDQQYQSLSTLQKQKSTSLAEINSKLAQLQGNLSSLNLSQSKGELKSKLNGVITETYTEIGQLVQAGSPIAKVADTSQFKITFDIPNAFLPELSQTKELSLSFDAIPNSYYIADITKVKPLANPNSKKITVEATLRSNQDPRLLPGLYATINLNSKTNSGLTIPSSALISRYGQTYVFINENNTAKKRKIEIIKRNEETILINGNIQPNNEIITKGHQWLRDGDEIEVQNKTIASKN